MKTVTPPSDMNHFKGKKMSEMKLLDIQKIECPCGKPINLWAEIISKEDSSHVVQWMVKCSDECGRTGMIWKNQFIYNWD